MLLFWYCIGTTDKYIRKFSIKKKNPLKFLSWLEWCQSEVTDNFNIYLPNAGSKYCRKEPNYRKIGLWLYVPLQTLWWTDNTRLSIITFQYWSKEGVEETQLKQPSINSFSFFILIPLICLFPPTTAYK